MKLWLIPALLLLVSPESTVRMEADGVRVSGELVTGAVVNLRSAGELPVLVSGSVIENLAVSGRSLELGLGEERRVSLATGLRLERLASGYRLSSHGPEFLVEGAGRTLTFESPVLFKTTPTGFDFGAQGELDAASISTGLAPLARMTQDPTTPPQDTPPPSRRRRDQALKDKETSRPILYRRVFGTADPTVVAEAADSHTVKSLIHLTPVGAP